MRFSRFALLLFSAAALALPSTAEAQDRPQTREGFYISFGFGAGSFGCSDCDRTTGVTGFLGLGGAIRDNVLLGFESTAWVKEESGVTLSSSNGVAAVYLYPNPESGFFVKGGLGFSVLELDVGPFGSGSDTGLGLTLGLGTDIRLGEMFSLTPVGNFMFGNFDGGSTNVLMFAMGVTWH